MARDSKPLFQELEVESSKRITALLYGVPKIGKTTLAASSIFVPEMRDVLILDAERSRDAVSHFEVEGAHLKFTTVPDFDTLATITTAFRRNDPQIRGINTVIVDTLSSMRANYLDEQAMGDRTSDKMKHRTEQVDYMKVTIVLRNFINALLAHDNLNIFVVSHQRELDTGHVRPDLNDALRQAVEANMSEMWYIHMDRKGNRVLEVLPTKSNAAMTVGARHKMFSENVEQYSLEHAPEGEDPEKWRGRLVVPEDNSLMQVLYDLHG